MLQLGRGISKTWSNSHSLSQHVCAKHHTIQTLDLVGEEARTYCLSTYFPLPNIENKIAIFIVLETFGIRNRVLNTYFSKINITTINN